MRWRLASARKSRDDHGPISKSDQFLDRIMNISVQESLSLKTAISWFAVILLVSLTPLWFAQFPPLNDYAGHLARIYIFNQLNGSEIFQHMYEFTTWMIPNVIMDISILLLAKVFPFELAGRIFVALTLGVILSGVVFLNYALTRRFSLWPFLRDLSS